MLLENGAGIETHAYFYYRFRDGYNSGSGTPLLAAVAGNSNPEVVELLLETAARTFKPETPATIRPSTGRCGAPSRICQRRKR